MGGEVLNPKHEIRDKDIEVQISKSNFKGIPNDPMPKRFFLSHFVI